MINSELKNDRLSEKTFSPQDVLAFLSRYDTIKLDDVYAAMNKQQREELLRTTHPYKIWQATDGRWRTYIADDTKPSKRKLVIKTSRTVLENFLIEYYQLEAENDKHRDYALKDIYPEWLSYKELHTTASSYVTRINTDWKSYYLNTPIIYVPLRKLDKLTLDVWAHNLIQKYDMTKNKYYNVTVIMRQALTYAVDAGIIPNNPFLEVKVDGKRLFRKTRKKADSKQVFTREEVRAIHDMAWEDFHNHVKVYDLAPLALLFQLQTGLRIGEVCAVKFSDIESPNYIHIQRMLRRDSNEVVEHPKTDCGDRQILLTSTAKKLIQTARERQQELHIESEFIFSVNGLPPTERSISTLYTKYCKHMGIVQKSSHTSRRTFISALIDQHVSINTVRATAGHSSERTTLRNYVFDRSTETEKLQKFEDALAL